MKFPRNARLLRSPFDIAPFAAVFFLLAMLLMLGGLLPTPGLPLRVPTANDLPGIDQPTVAMAIDGDSRLYFANQLVSERELKIQLANAMKRFPLAPTLIVHADKAVSFEQLTHLTLLARDAGITNTLLATLPRAIKSPAKP